MIAIIDYGAGNIKSLQFALDRLEIESILTNEPEEIKNADALILPGVGAFADAINELRKLELETVIQTEVANGKPLLGICLGMQMLYETSDEGGISSGLGLLKGNIKLIPNTVKVPHMGWNELNMKQTQPIVSQIAENAYVYFVHSYFATNTRDNEIVATADYDILVPAIVQKDNVIGIQFHPEKSGEVGLQILKNFGGIVS